MRRLAKSSTDWSISPCTTCAAPCERIWRLSASAAKWPSAVWVTSCAESRAPTTPTITSTSAGRRWKPGRHCCSTSKAAHRRSRPSDGRRPADLQGPLLNLGIAVHGSLRFDPTLLLLETDELRGKALPVGEDGREMGCEVPDIARQDHLALRIQHLGGLHPGRYQRFTGLKPLCRWGLDR